VDYSKAYNKDSTPTDIAAGVLFSVFADCNPGDIAVGGNFGVNGPAPFFVYFAGTENDPTKFGSTTDTAGFFIFTVSNTGTSAIRIFSTVTCAPPVS